MEEFNKTLVYVHGTVVLTVRKLQKQTCSQIKILISLKNQILFFLHVLHRSGVPMTPLKQKSSLCQKFPQSEA